MDEENKMEVIAEEAKEMVSEAVKGLDGKEKIVIAGCATAVAVVSIAVWEAGKKVAPKVKNFVKKVFTKAPAAAPVVEAVEQ